MAGLCNISPVDLDILTGVAVHLLGEAPIDLMGSLVEVSNGGPVGDCYVNSPGWVERLVRIPDGSIDLLAGRWTTALAGEYATAAMDEDELLKGLRDLIEVCRNAVSHETGVVLVWT